MSAFTWGLRVGGSKVSWSPYSKTFTEPDTPLTPTPREMQSQGCALLLGCVSLPPPPVWPPYPSGQP